MATRTDFLWTASGATVSILGGVWVRARNNDTTTDYYSSATTDGVTGQFSVTAPPGWYTLYSGGAATVVGTPTQRNPNWEIPVTAGDDIVGKSFTADPTSPYAPNLPGASSIPTPAGVTTGKVWDWGGMGYNVKAANVKGDGVTDDTAALASAWTAAGASPLQAPPGTYIQKLPLVSPIAGASIMGAGGGSTIFQAGSGWAGAQQIDLTFNNTAIRGIEFSGASGTYSSNPAADCIRVFGANTVWIEDCTGYSYNGWFINAVPNGTSNPFGLYFTNLFTNLGKQGIHLQGQSVGNYSVAAMLTNCFMSHKQAGDGLFLDAVHDVMVLNYQGVLDGGASAFSCVHINDNCAGLYFFGADCGGISGGAYTGTSYFIEHGAGTRANSIQFLGGVTSAQGVGMSVDADDFLMSGHTFLQSQGDGVKVIGAGSNIVLRDMFVRQSNLATGTNYDVRVTNTTGSISLRDSYLESTGASVTANLLSVANLTYLGCVFSATTKVAGTLPTAKITYGGVVDFPANGVYNAATGNGHFFQVNGATMGSFDSNGNLGFNGTVILVKNVAAQGYGFPAIYQAPAPLTAQTAAVASVATLTSPNDGAKHTYMVSGFVTITTLGSGSFNLQVSYTDSNGTARTCNIPLAAQAGTFGALANTADDYKGTVEITVNPNTAVTIKTAGTFTGCTYNVGGNIKQVL